MVNQSTKPALKTNFAIRTTDENFRTHIETLKALGYEIAGIVTRAGSIEDCNFLARNELLINTICRHAGSYHMGLTFDNIQDFLAWHFTPEAPKKSESEILLDSLEEDMRQLQAKIAEVRNVINKRSN